MLLKKCKGCARNLPIEQFDRHSQMRDGHLNYCKACISAKNAARYRKNASRICARSAAWRRENAERLRHYRKAYYIANEDECNAKAKQRAADPTKRAQDAQRRHEYYQKNKERMDERAKEYRQSDRGREVMDRAHRRERIVHAEKIKARTAVSNAIRDGRLTRPDACCRCGQAGFVEAHHEHGYDRGHMLDVIWLCPHCHKQADAKAAAA